MAKKESKKITSVKTENGNPDYAVVDILIERTNKENPKLEDLELLEEAFNLVPALYQTNGNIQKQIFNDIINIAFSHTAFFREAVKKHIAEMKIKLGYETSTFVEQMLIDEIAMRYLRLQVVESQHKNATYESHTFAKGMYYDRRLEMAHKRFLKSMETLARVRKLIAATQAKGAEMFKNLIEADKAGKGD